MQRFHAKIHPPKCTTATRKVETFLSICGCIPLNQQSCKIFTPKGLVNKRHPFINQYYPPPALSIECSLHFCCSSSSSSLIHTRLLSSQDQQTEQPGDSSRSNRKLVPNQDDLLPLIVLHCPTLPFILRLYNTHSVYLDE